GSMAVNLVPEKSANYHKKAVFHFTDLGESWTVFIRRGVVEIQPRALENPDLTITTTSMVWKEVVAKIRSPLAAIATGKLKIDGGLSEFKTFMDMFKET
ncbi:MAG: MBL fold metallo-hydrolase, partial [Bacteroidetes bacterium]